MSKKIVLMGLIMSLLITPIQVSAADNNVNGDNGFSENLITTFGSSIPTGYFNTESGSLALNANSSTYSNYIIYNQKDSFTVYLTSDPTCPNFVLYIEMIDCKTNKVVADWMIMLFQQSTVLNYGLPFTKEYTGQQCYFRFSNLSDTKGSFKYNIW